MYLLRFSVLITILSIFMACSSHGPLTPVQAYERVAESVKKRDIEALWATLSSGTIRKVNIFSSELKKLSKRQMTFLAAPYGLSPEKIQKLSNKELSAVLFMSESSKASLENLLKEKIVSVDINNRLADVKTSGNRTYTFLKEGPYWKIDLSNF